MIKIYTKQIDDKGLVEFINLYHNYLNSFDTRFSWFQTVSLLVQHLTKPGSIAFGLYKEEKLIGFTLGWEENKVSFYYDSLYILSKYRIYIKRLYMASEQCIQDYGYSFWSAYGTKKHTISLHKRMGAKIVSIEKDKVKFIKEI